MAKIVRNFIYLAALAGMISATPALAAVEEMIITSERREANLQEVPIAVTAMSSAQLEDFQVFEAKDLQRYVPSLNMFNNVSSPTNLSPSLRGGLQQDASLVTAESPFGIYVDDIYVGRLNGNNVTLSDIDRVEVLRGPQGTLYGRNTAYGAIRYLSRTPGEDLWFDASAGVGNFDQLRVNASVGGPLGDAWAGSLAAQYNTKDGQYFNVAENVDTDEHDNTAVRGKLRFMGSDTFDAVLSASYSKSEHDSNQMPRGITPGIPSSCLPPNPPCGPGETTQFTTDDLVWVNGEFRTNTPWGPYENAPEPLRDRPTGETKQTIVGLTLAWDINENMQLKSITGYVGMDDRFTTDFNGNSADPAEFLAVIGATDVDSDQFTQEFQLLGTIGDRFNYLGGIYYLNEDADQLFGWNLANLYDFNTGALIVPQAFAPLSQTMIEVETDSISFFGEGSFDFTDRLKGTVGLRWTQDDKDFNAVFEGFLFGIPPTPIPLEAKDDEWTPRFVLDYNLDDLSIADSMLLYAQAAKGFKGGGFSAIALFTPDAIGVYGPETNWTYEGGLKADWFDRRLRTNLAIFFSDIEDIQQNATDTSSGGLEFPVENSGDAEIKGLEFEIISSPIDGLNIFLVGSLLDGKYTRLNPNSSAAAAEAKYNVKPQTPQTPDYAYTIGFDYTFDMPGDFFGNTSFGLDYYDTDNYITAATNDFYNSGWDQLNGFIAMELADNWELRLTGKNLGDETNVVSGSRDLGGFIFLPPREYIFTVTFQM